MKTTDEFHIPEPPPWTSSGASASANLLEPNPPDHACNNCLAPCCWSVILESSSILQEKDLGHINNYLLYERLLVWLQRGGRFALAITTPCRHFDRETCACSIHGQPQQPEICSVFDASACWYRELGEKVAPEVLRLDLETWPAYRREVSCRPGGLVLGLPEFQTLPERSQVSFPYPATLQFLVSPNLVEGELNASNYLYFFSNFSGCRLARTPEDWVVLFDTRRAVPTPLENFEMSPDGDVMGFPADKIVLLEHDDLWRLLASGSDDFHNWPPERFRDLRR